MGDRTTGWMQRLLDELVRRKMSRMAAGDGVAAWPVGQVVETLGPAAIAARFPMHRMLRSASSTLLAVCLATACTPRAELSPLPAADLDGMQAPVARLIGAAHSAVERRPRDAAANGYLAMVLHAHDRFAAAAICYERTRALQPQSARWAYLHGDALAQAGRAAEAMQAFRDAVKAAPQALRARVRLADLLARNGDHAGARNLYEQVLAEAPTRADAHYGLGQLLNDLGEPEAAVGHFERVLEIVGDNGPTHYALAEAHRRRGDTQAVQRHRRVFERFRDVRIPVDDPLLTELYALQVGDRPLIERAQALYRAGDLPGARAAFEQALAVNADSAIAHANLVAVAGALDGLGGARRHYELAVALDAKVAIAHSNYATLLLKNGQAAAAEQALRRAADIDRADADVLTNLGFAIELQQRADEAAAYYREALALDAGHALANYLLGRQRVAAGEHAQAVALLERSAAADSPHRLRALLTLADARRATGSHTAAVEALREAHALAARSGNAAVAAQIAERLARWQDTG